VGEIENNIWIFQDNDATTQPYLPKLKQTSTIFTHQKQPKIQANQPHHICPNLNQPYPTTPKLIHHNIT
jgi:hypothetical protein